MEQQRQNFSKYSSKSKLLIYFFSCENAALQVLMSVHLSVCVSNGEIMPHSKVALSHQRLTKINQG